MTLSEPELTEVVEAVWSGMLGLPMVAAPGSNGPLPDTTPQLTGCIHVSTGWEGSVLVEVPEGVARELAAAMFARDASELADDDVVDALGEVTNMIGGNVKAMVGGEVLSLPSVTRGKSFLVHVPGSRLEAESSFECSGSPARVLLLARGDL